MLNKSTNIDNVSLYSDAMQSIPVTTTQIKDIFDSYNISITSNEIYRYRHYTEHSIHIICIVKTFNKYELYNVLYFIQEMKPDKFINDFFLKKGFSFNVNFRGSFFPFFNYEWLEDKLKENIKKFGYVPDYSPYKGYIKNKQRKEKLERIMKL